MAPPVVQHEFSSTIGRVQCCSVAADAQHDEKNTTIWMADIELTEAPVVCGCSGKQRHSIEFAEGTQDGARSDPGGAENWVSAKDIG